MLAVGGARHPSDARPTHIRSMHRVCSAARRGCEAQPPHSPKPKFTHTPSRFPLLPSRSLVARFAGVAHRWGVGPAPLKGAASQPPIPSANHLNPTTLRSRDRRAVPSPPTGTEKISKGAASLEARRFASSARAAPQRGRGRGPLSHPDPGLTQLADDPSTSSSRDANPGPNPHTKPIDPIELPFLADDGCGADHSESDLGWGGVSPMAWQCLPLMPLAV